MLDLNSPKDAHVAERLRTELIMWLSSTRPDGRPHLVPVWFLWDGQSILIFSKPNNQKIRNLRQNSNVMVSLEAANEGEDIVLIEGQATLLEESTSEVMPPEYVEKYSAQIAAFQWTPEGMAAEYSQAIRIQPTRFIAWGE
ncbi:MAG TPA: TIGR03667 family PPOX class F420-dependent oxidoreductase [Herpetosiphonaceae bacterium]